MSVSVDGVLSARGHAVLPSVSIMSATGFGTLANGKHQEEMLGSNALQPNL